MQNMPLVLYSAGCLVFVCEKFGQGLEKVNGIKVIRDYNINIATDIIYNM